jgi:DNA-binding beta-propeller fold protein YncE
MSRFSTVRLSLLVAVSAAAALALPSAAAAAPTFLGPTLGTGTPGGVSGQLSGPTGANFDAQGNVYVADTQNQRISVFGPDGGFLRAFGFDVDTAGIVGPEVCTATCKPGVGGSAAGQLNNPTGVAVGATEVYVADNLNRRIDVFTASGTFLRAFGVNVDPAGGAGFEVCSTTCQAGTSLAPDPGAVSNPYDVDVDAAGKLYVIENVNNRISVFDAASSTFERAFGFDVVPGGTPAVETCTSVCQAAPGGGGPGQLGAPLGIDVAGNSLYIADQGNDRVVVYNTAGAFLRAFGYDVIPAGPTGLEACTTQCQAGVGGGAAGQLEAPRGVGGTPDGNVFVADQANSRLALFTGAGAFIHAFGFDVDTGGGGGSEVCTTSCQQGDFGSAPGQLSLTEDAVVDCRGSVWSVDLTNHRVQRFGEPAAELPPCSGPPVDPPVKPSNEFTIGKLKLNKRKGTAKLAVETPGPGALALAGKLVEAVQAQVGAGTTSLPIKPKGKAKRKLKQVGKAKVAVDVAFTPIGGDANTQARKLKLKRKR